MTELSGERCQACHGKVLPLDPEAASALLPQLHEAWTLRDGRISRRIRTRDFARAFALATEVALVAEREGHHPDLRMGWGYLEAELTTHQAGGLTRNDFVMAAKIDRLVNRGGDGGDPQ